MPHKNHAQLEARMELQLKFIQKLSDYEVVHLHGTFADWARQADLSGWFKERYKHQYGMATDTVCVSFPNYSAEAGAKFLQSVQAAAGSLGRGGWYASGNKPKNHVKRVTVYHYDQAQFDVKVLDLGRHPFYCADLKDWFLYQNEHSGYDVMDAGVSGLRVYIAKREVLLAEAIATLLSGGSIHAMANSLYRAYFVLHNPSINLVESRRCYRWLTTDKHFWGGKLPDAAYGVGRKILTKKEEQIKAEFRRLD